MEEVIFCGSCGKVVSKEFSYCPYCGSRVQSGPAFQEVIDESFDQLEKSVRTIAFERLQNIERQLNSLDGELSAFMAKK
jgi:DNA-directed RNA polymerase subunit N (RpoN/RPB10)